MKLIDLASTIRSKNAGVNQITFDIIFGPRQISARAQKQGDHEEAGEAVLNSCRAFRISSFSPANAISSLYRLRPGGSRAIGTSSAGNAGRCWRWKFRTKSAFRFCLIAQAVGQVRAGHRLPKVTVENAPVRKMSAFSSAP
jgi:hypothetical protein